MTHCDQGQTCTCCEPVNVSAREVVWGVSALWTAIILAVALLLSGCATIGSKEAAVTCQAADAVTTVIALGKVGVYEANPIVAGIIKATGIPGFLLFKAGVAYLLTREEVPTEARAVVNVVTCGAAIHNILL